MWPLRGPSPSSADKGVLCKLPGKYPPDLCRGEIRTQNRMAGGRIWTHLSVLPEPTGAQGKEKRPPSSSDALPHCSAVFERAHLCHDSLDLLRHDSQGSGPPAFLFERTLSCLRGNDNHLNRVCQVVREDQGDRTAKAQVVQSHNQAEDSRPPNDDRSPIDMN